MSMSSGMAVIFIALVGDLDLRQGHRVLPDSGTDDMHGFFQRHFAGDTDAFAVYADALILSAPTRDDAQC